MDISKVMIQYSARIFPALTKLQWAAFIAILFLGVFLRIHHIDRPMLYDETYTYEVYAHTGISHAIARYDYPNNHILHSVLVHFSTLFNQGEIAIRMPALLFSLASLILFFMFVRKLFGVPSALYALLLFALSRYQIDYAHNARGYAMNVFFTLLSAYGVFSIIEYPSSGKARQGLVDICGRRDSEHVYAADHFILYCFSGHLFPAFIFTAEIP